MAETYNASVLLDRNLDAGRGDKVAVHWSGGSVTYRGLHGLACAAGRRFEELGVRREERILLALDDSPAMMAAFWGAIRIGAVPVPVNPLLQRSEDYDHYFADSLARVVIVDAMTGEKVRGAAGRAAQTVDIIEAAEILALPSANTEPARTTRDDVCFWLYSSGSTGLPKGVVHLQHDIEYTCETYARQVLGITEGDTAFSTTKMFHAYGLGNSLSFPCWAGATTVLFSGRPTPAAVLEMIERERPTLFFSAPTFYNAILNQEGVRERDLSSIRQCVAAAEALPAEVWRRWKEAFGQTIIDGIGSTELLHIYCSNRPEDVRPGSSGKPVPGYELKVLDPDGDAVPDGDAGDMYVKGDSALAFYWRQHEKTKRSVLGEWFLSGDRYRRDSDGYYWYEGRSDDMIKVSGLWVSPIEVEGVLLAHPAVGESAVVGIEVDGFMKIKAFVVAKVEGTPELAGELQEHCKARLQRYQFPHLIEFVAELPKTLTGKIQRYKLRESTPVA
jgi:benzoate-CoA ligase family protein